MSLIFVRHPPCLDGTGRCYGRLDLKADDTYLAATLPELIDALPERFQLISSPALRCRQVAEAMLALAPTRLAADWQLDPLVHEMDFGDWEGCRWDEVPRYLLDAWAADIWQYRPGGGESAADVRERWYQFQQPFLRQEPDALPTVVLSHAGFIRMALAESGWIHPAERWTYPIDYLSPYPISFAPDKT